jgi:hypothetical protein
MTQPDPLDQLRQALDIVPSPAFAARVRRHVATQPTRVVWWAGRDLATAGAAVCLVAVVLAVARWSGTEESAVRSEVPVASTVSAVAAAPSTPDVPVAPSSLVRRPRTSPIQVAAPESVFAETLVPDDQRIALERLIAAIRTGRITVPAVVAENDTVDDDGRRLPRALVIEPLKLELLAGTPAEPNKDSIKDLIK